MTIDDSELFLVLQNLFVQVYFGFDFDGPWKQPDEIVSELGLGDASVLNSFETLLAAVKKNYTREQTQRIIQGFVDNSVVQDIGVPEELTNK